MKINKRQMKYIKEMLACLYIELNNDEEKFVLSEFLLFQHNIEIFHKWDVADTKVLVNFCPKIDIETVSYEKDTSLDKEKCLNDLKKYTVINNEK